MEGSAKVVKWLRLDFLLFLPEANEIHTTCCWLRVWPLRPRALPCLESSINRARYAPRYSKIHTPYVASMVSNKRKHRILVQNSKQHWTLNVLALGPISRSCVRTRSDGIKIHTAYSGWCRGIFGAWKPQKDLSLFRCPRYLIPCSLCTLYTITLWCAIFTTT